MTEQPNKFPRRDADGRVASLGDLLGVSLAGLIVGLVALVLFDGVFASFGAGEFGRTNGWLAVILPAWLYWDDFRAWEFGAARVAAALLAGLVAGVAGLMTAGLVTGAPLLSGGLGAAVFTLGYAVLWFPSVRWLVRRTG